MKRKTTLVAGVVAALVGVAACGPNTNDDGTGSSTQAAKSCHITDWSSIGASYCSFDGKDLVICDRIDSQTRVASSVAVKVKDAQGNILDFGLTLDWMDQKTFVYKIHPAICHSLEGVCCNSPFSVKCLYDVVEIRPCDSQHPSCLVPLSCAGPDWNALGFESCRFETATRAVCKRSSPPLPIPQYINLTGQSASGRVYEETMKALDQVFIGPEVIYEGSFLGVCNTPIDGPCSINLCSATECDTEAPYYSCYMKPRMPRPYCCDTFSCCYRTSF